jgi:hypothetical protein
VITKGGAGSPTGTVQFLDGKVVLDTAKLRKMHGIDDVAYGFPSAYRRLPDRPQLGRKHLARLDRARPASPPSCRIASFGSRPPVRSPLRLQRPLQRLVTVRILENHKEHQEHKGWRKFAFTWCSS